MERFIIREPRHLKSHEAYPHTATNTTLREDLINAFKDYLVPGDLDVLSLISPPDLAEHLSGLAQVRLATLRTNLTADSLKKLEIISNDPRIAPHFKRLQIGHFVRPYFGNEVNWVRDKSGQLDIAQGGAARVLGVVERFENCTSFEVIRAPREVHDRAENLVASDAVNMLLNIIVECQRTVEEFSIDFPETWTRFHPRWTSANLRGIISTPLEKAGFEECWRNVRSLNLTMNVFTDAHRDFALRLVQYSENLERLTLRMAFNEASLAAMNEVLSSPLPSKLKELHLNEVKLPSAGSLLGFLYTHRDTLKRLTLENASLGMQGSWMNIFQALGSDFPALEHLAIKDAMEHHPARFGKIRFRPAIESFRAGDEEDTMFKVTGVAAGECPEKPITGISYTGSMMRFAVQKIQEWAVVGLS